LRRVFAFGLVQQLIQPITDIVLRFQRQTYF